MRTVSVRRDRFRIAHCSIQSNHLHLLVEAGGKQDLSRGIQGLVIRLATALNSMLGRRGRLWADRYDARALRTPRETRNAIIYVLANWRKHDVASSGWLDPYSSAPMFELCAERQVLFDLLIDRSPWLAKPTTWLASAGFLRGGRMSIRDVPGRS